ncbi:hypothetical protein [Pandoraea apista]|uniref:hypothetical protein n=1 Tax=Pandoraea apista TaxID=93218 RepID=UPI000B25C169|nr:hypothetical protein [Pandoraea apista]
MNTMPGQAETEAKDTPRKAIDNDSKHRSTDANTVFISDHLIDWRVIQFYDFQDPGHLTGPVLIREPPLSFANTVPSYGQVIGVDFLDATLNGS